jgi:hypothetical protein
MSRPSMVVVLLLFISFFLQPLYRVSASTELPPVPDTAQVAELAEQATLDIPIDSDPAIAVPSENTIGSPTQEIGQEPFSQELTPVETPEPETASSTSDEVIPEGSTSPEDDVFIDGDGSTTTLVEVVGQISSTTEVVELELPLIHESYGDDEVTFAKDNCVLVEDGSYYCQTDKAKGSASDSIISEPDSGGDLEIFVVKDGEYHQITHNFVDDAAPFYDGRSKTIVWHRLINDRYVIVSYDVQSGQESLLTDGSFNDMEPTRFGSFTVWQRWIDGNWHIMLHDGAQLTQLTTAVKHHVAPHIRSDLIMWQTTGANGEKQLEAYDIETATLTTIDETEGVAMANPRMMMVYEAVYDNGDVVMRGVDLKTGKVSVLDVVPSSLPTEVPESDSTGETRALIQNKSHENDIEISEREPEPDPLLPNLSSSSTAELTIDLRSDVPSSTVQSETPTSTAFDLYIAPATSTQNSLEL